LRNSFASCSFQRNAPKVIDDRSYLLFAPEGSFIISDGESIESSCRAIDTIQEVTGVRRLLDEFLNLSLPKGLMKKPLLLTALLLAWSIGVVPADIHAQKNKKKSRIYFQGENTPATIGQVIHRATIGTVVNDLDGDNIVGGAGR